MILRIRAEPFCLIIFKLRIWCHGLLHQKAHCLFLIRRNAGPLHRIAHATAKCVCIRSLKSIEASATVEIAELQDFSPLFIKCDLFLDRGKLLFFHITEVALISAHPECCHLKSCLKRCIAQGLMIRAGGNMGTHNRHRIAVAVTVLDLCTAERIRIITCPDLWKIAEHTRVKPVSPRCASLK